MALAHAHEHACAQVDARCVHIHAQTSARFSRDGRLPAKVVAETLPAKVVAETLRAKVEVETLGQRHCPRRSWQRCSEAARGWFASCYFEPMWRIASLALLRRPMRLLAASIGVAFAACLFWLPAAVYLGLRANASALVRHAGAELWLADANTEFLDQAIPFPRARASRIEADACAAHSEPLLITYTPYTTSNGGHDGLQLIGTSRASLPWSSVVGLPSDLVRPGAVAIDLADEPTRRVHGEPELEVGEHVLDVRVRTGGIRSVGLTPIAFASPTSARTALGMPATETHFVLIDVEDDACRAHLLSLASQVHGLRAFTSEELSLLSEDQLVTRSGVAVALAFVTLLGMLVAGVFVAQTLISTLEESRRDLAMLSALGASRGEIVTFTLVQANLVLVIGTVLGGALVRLVLPMTRALALQLSVPPWLVVLGVVVLTSLCLASALFAVLRGRSIRAVEVLK